MIFDPLSALIGFLLGFLIATAFWLFVLVRSGM